YRNRELVDLSLRPRLRLQLRCGYCDEFRLAGTEFYRHPRQRYLKPRRLEKRTERIRGKAGRRLEVPRVRNQNHGPQWNDPLCVSLMFGLHFAWLKLQSVVFSGGCARVRIIRECERQ